MKRMTIVIAGGWMALQFTGLNSMADEHPTKIFRCESQGRLTYADRPCADRSVVDETRFDKAGVNFSSANQTTVTLNSEVVLKPTNSFRSPMERKSSDQRVLESASNHRSNNRSSVDTGSIAGEQIKQKQRLQAHCSLLLKQLHAVQSKLRSGYTAKQRDGLQERRRQLEEQLRQSRCH